MSNLTKRNCKFLFSKEIKAQIEKLEGKQYNLEK